MKYKTVALSVEQKGGTSCQLFDKYTSKLSFKTGKKRKLTAGVVNSQYI